MSSIVLELQKDALNKDILVSDLLRKGLVIARKLKLQEFESWINNELNGYDKNVNIPEYRTVQGEVKALNPYRGYIPVIFETSEQEKIYSKRKCGQSVAELGSLIKNQGKDQLLQMPFSADIQRSLTNGSGMDFPVTLVLSSSRIVGILDSVRTIILNWTLKLEEDGVLGEGFSFSAQEKEKASREPQSINNFFGPISNSQIQVGNRDSVQIAASTSLDLKKVQDFLILLKESIDKLSVGVEEKKELDSDIKSVEAQLSSPKPKPSMIKEGLSSIRKILEGAGGKLVADLLIYLGKILF
jgi:hypothetical protein